MSELPSPDDDDDSPTMSSPSPAQQLLTFVQSSPSPFHTVETAARLLVAGGYRRLDERSDSDFADLAQNGKYFVVRNGSSIVAVAIGGRYVSGNGFTIAAAHTDSPCLKVKPISNVVSSSMVQVGVHTYGGGLWHTWFDRDLSLAGRVFVADDDDAHRLRARLVHVQRPLMTIPDLAIHLNRDVANGFKPNLETELVPILATEVKAALIESAAHSAPVSIAKAATGSETASHSPVLVEVLATELHCAPDRIRDFELSLFGVQPPCIGGVFDEFVFAPRLDNLAMSFCSLKGLLEADSSLDTDMNVRVVAMFDHEEIGSVSAQGAASNMLETLIRRITKGVKLESAMAKSMIISADMAHACHPNYNDKHEGRHKPKINGGVVIKTNPNQRYATNSETSCIVKEIAGRNGVPMQEFVVRNDMGCGSTVGPILAANIGVRVVDVGLPQLAMHSIRETCGVDDVDHGVRLLRGFFQDYVQVDAAVDRL